MRKYGKYEQMPDGTRAKQPPAKSLLLQTYMTSLLCLILCVTMFFVNFIIIQGSYHVSWNLLHFNIFLHFSIFTQKY